MKGKRARSSITGRFVPDAQAATAPDYTVLETINDMHVVQCSECDSMLGALGPGSIEHHDDGSHTFHPERTTS